MPAGQVSINIALNSASYTQGLQAISRQTQQFGNTAKAASASTVGSMQAASASIRALENPMSLNIRTLARFAAQSQTLQKVFQAAFPVVGVLAAGALVAKLGMEVAKAITTIEKMPQAITKGFSSLNLSAALTNDELKLTNDNLQNAINKLEGKPQNNVKTALDEARVAADKLATSIEADNVKLNELLSKNHLSSLGLLIGSAGTADREGTAKYYSNQQDKYGLDYQQAVANGDKSGAAKALKNLDDSRNSELANVTNDYNQRKGQEKGGPDQAANMADDVGIATNILAMKNATAERLRNADLEHDKQAAEDAKTANEAAKKAAGERLKTMEDALHNEEIAGNLLALQVETYWKNYIAGLDKGSTEYLVNYHEVTTKIASAAEQWRAEKKKYAATLESEKKRSGSEDMEGVDIFNRSSRDFQQDAMRSAGENNQGYIDNNQEAMDAAKNAAKAQEAKLTDDAGRSISRYAAAQAIANEHSKEYVTIQQSLAAIEDIRRDQQKNDPNKETDRNLSAAQMALANAAAERQLQINSDNDAVNGRSSSGVAGFQDAINEFVTASKDAAAQMRDLTLNTIQGLNQTIQHVLTTPHMTGLQTRTAFRDYGAGVASNVVGTGLQKVEGSVLGAFGGGKLGTRANPMVVTFADGTTSAGAASGIGGMLGKLFGGGGSSPQGPGMAGLSQALGQSSEAADNDAAGGVSSIVSTFAGLIPFLATGGSINGPAIVGEQGPELFMPSGAGTIIPNHKLKSSSGAATNSQVINIDATGSTDPAQTTAQIHRAMQQYVPLIAANTIKTQREQTMRKPPSAGR